MSLITVTILPFSEQRLGMFTVIIASIKNNVAPEDFLRMHP
jgi:hypothetical protein